MRRVYRMRKGWVAFFVAGAAFFGIAAGGCFYGGERGLAALFVPFFLLMLAVLRTRVEVDETTITVRGTLTERRMDLAEIAGYRIRQDRNVSTLLLISSTPEKKPLHVAQLFQFDAEWTAWLGTLTNLDAVEVANTLVAVASEHGEDALPRGRAIARTMTAAAVGAAAWAISFPRPYRLSIACNVALPLFALAILVAGRGLYAADQRRTDPRPSLALPLILPGVAVAMRALFDFHLLDPLQLLWPGLAIALTLAFTAWRADGRASRWNILVHLFLFAMYSGGALSGINGAFDDSSPQVYAAVVLGRETIRGKSTEYRLKLAPWGPRTAAEWTSVRRPVYERAQDGRPVRVVLREGRLRMPWFYVVAP